MFDGELIKRIIKTSENLGTATNFNTATQKVETYDVLEIRSILDEVKRDFESLYYITNYRSSINKETQDFWLELNNLIKKWFGETQT